MDKSNRKYDVTSCKISRKRKKAPWEKSVIATKNNSNGKGICQDVTRVRLEINGE